MDILSGIDGFTKLLSFGISGFCVILMILAYNLIRQIITSGNQNPTVVRLIYAFMAINLLNVVIVGFLGLPAISRNQKLMADNIETKQELRVKQKELVFTEKTSELNNIINQTKGGRNPASVVKDSLTVNSQKYLNAFDSLVQSYVDAGSYKADSLRNYRKMLSEHLNILKADTDLETKENAAFKFNQTNRKVSELVWLKTDEVKANN